MSPPTDSRIQCFPVETWREEFFLARKARLDRIEWIYEFDTEAANPLRTEDGVAAIRRLAESSGVAVRSVCADYYMHERLVAQDGAPNEAAVRHLVWLLGRVSQLGAQYIVLPFVDESSLRSPQEIEGLVEVLASVTPTAEHAGVELHLETDLEARDLEALLRDQLSRSFIRVNYDIGNEASAGHDPKGDLTLIGPWLGSVHVKDRVLGGDTVPLGTGAADFEACFHMFAHAGYNGTFILQAARGGEGDEMELAKRNREFVSRNWLAAQKRLK